MNAQLANLFSYIKNLTVVVFWIDSTVKGDIYHRLSEVRGEDDELKAFFDDNTDRYVDLYSVDFNDIRVYQKVDWLI
jgi:hypothetical protein